MFGLGFQSFRRALPVIIGAVLFGVGLYALYTVLKPVDFADVVAQFRATSPQVLAMALGATIIGYASLIFYDWYALRYIGKDLPLGVVGLGGFLGYAFGNTIGVSVVSGGAVRYRIYSAVGLTALEVAAVSGYAAVVLGIGLTLFGLAALVLRPEVVTSLFPVSEVSVQYGSAAAIALTLLVVTFLSISQRQVRIRGIDLRLPPIQDLAGQLVVTAIDIVATAFVLWVLLPTGKTDFPLFVAEFSAATLIGVISNVPGGIGVFETVMIRTMPPTVPVADAAAALLMYRLIYYIFPFALGFLVVALNEVRAVSGFGSSLLSRAPAPVPGRSDDPSRVGAPRCGCGRWRVRRISVADRHDPRGARDRRR